MLCISVGARPESAGFARMFVDVDISSAPSDSNSLEIR